jgi:hypothetical protein
MIVFLGIVVALAGFGALALGVPNWAFGIGNTLITGGSIALVGGLLLVGIGLVLKSLRELANKIEALSPFISVEAQAPLAPVEEEPAALQAAPPPARQPMLPRNVAPPARPEPRRAALDRRPASETVAPTPAESTRPRAWPPRTSASRAAPSEPVSKPELERAVKPDVERAIESAVERAIERPRERARLTPEAHAPEAPAAQTLEPLHDDPVAPALVVRSGIISGMAYTLYSDGSIEAELPMGTVRFASVEELRAHVARTGADADTEFSGRTPVTQ